jgi:NAD(P)-dependent dehydrogenase (short-subunit alcohol dehydrogenase family)
MKRLENKVALITGGSSGIGLATAQDFIREGAHVIITGRSPQALQEALALLDGQAQTLVSDSGSREDLKALGEKVKALTPSLDILFVNAGIGKFAPIEQVDEAHFDEQFSVNVKGLFFTVQQLLPLIKPGGSIILNASVVRHVGTPNTSVYSATKAAVVSLTKTLAAELVGRKIRVNAISPGLTQTNFFTNTGLSEEQIAGFAGQMLPKIPLQRLGNSPEIAKAVTFLASDEASYIVGEELKVDGGWTNL